jgi:tetratricopeptide (TPR) repeat protein
LNITNNLESKIRYYATLSVYLRIIGDTENAKNAALEALKFANTHKDSIRYKSIIFNSLGTIADDDSKIQTAIKYHLIALRYAESIKNDNQIAIICGSIGRAYQYLSEYDTAKKYFNRAIKIKEDNNEQDKHLAVFYTNLSNCYDAEGNYDKSLYYLDKSIQLKIKNHIVVSLIPSLNNKAFTQFLMNDFSEAEKTIKEAMKLADSIKIENEQMYVYSTYAEILLAQNRIFKAEELLNKSVELSKRNNDLYLAKYNLDILYNIHLKKKDYKLALEYYKQRTIVMDTVNSVKSRKAVEKLALDYDTEKKNKEIELLNKEKQLNEIELKRSNLQKGGLLLITILMLLVITLLWVASKNKIKTAKIKEEISVKSFEKKIAESEMQALRAQMNPHFLFNSLNSINNFIIKNDQEQASEYLSKFSMLIRRVLSNSNSSRVTLANELEALELYIELESLRFNKKFEYTIDIGSEVEVDYIEIPPLLIQPYVENSIWHGLMHKQEGLGELTISINQSDDALVCVVEDNGIGREAALEIKSKTAVKRKSFGMNITKERLKYINLKFKASTDIIIEDLKDCNGVATGTRVEIKIGI